MSAAISTGYENNEPLRGVAREDPRQLEDLGDVRLPVQDRALRIEAEGEPRGGAIEREIAQGLPIPHRRERVVVRDEVQGVRRRLGRERDRRSDHPEPVPDVGAARRLDPRQRDRPLRHASSATELTSGCYVGPSLGGPMKPAREEAKRERGQDRDPHRDRELGPVLERIREDAERDPKRYAEESEVPAGGE
jgi:hypothetical protein